MRLIFFALLLTANFSAAENVLFENVTLIDGNGGKAAKGMYVTVIGGKIHEISDRAPKAMGGDVMRISGKIRPGNQLNPAFRGNVTVADTRFN